MKTAIPLPLESIRDICRKYDVAELAVFGSVLHNDFRPDSDVDFLVTFRNNDAGPWGCKLTDIEEEFSTLLGRPVDVVTRASVEHSRNWIIRRSILANTEVLYGP